MPKPIVCLSDELRQFMIAFCTCFSKRQWKYFVTVLRKMENGDYETLPEQQPTY